MELLKQQIQTLTTRVANLEERNRDFSLTLAGHNLLHTKFMETGLEFSVFKKEMLQAKKSDALIESTMTDAEVAKYFGADVLADLKAKHVPCFSILDDECERVSPYPGAILIQVGFCSPLSPRAENHTDEMDAVHIWMPADAMTYAPWIIRGLLFRAGFQMENIDGLWAQILNTSSAPEHSQINMEI